MFELSGADTPQQETKDNDLSITWRQSAEREFTLVMEIKG